MRHLAAAEAQGDLHLVAFLEEALHGPHLDVVIVVVDAGAKLDFLDLDGLLLLARFGLLLLLVEAEFAVVEDLADGRRRVRRDLDQIEARLLGGMKGIEEGHDAAILAGLIDQLHFANAANISIGARSVFLRNRHGSHRSANGFDLLSC